MHFNGLKIWRVQHQQMLVCLYFRERPRWMSLYVRISNQ